MFVDILYASIALVAGAGFAGLQGFGGLNREPFVLRSRRLLLVTTKTEDLRFFPDAILWTRNASHLLIS